ncbi:hypothetical protein [Paenibacillus lemnae]|uniref:Uncharacterized protein n=1 Tax=Paenibacillus lemnae TaxID=1330551 RepID=A0A848M7R0_PAELE|nr:hypothetical protein [Paenibacillus lemnae]NMO97238.1 hypothetical protein [Paenibacillus lemnae]
MRKACNQTAWGLIFLLLDIRIGFLDILPDLIGVILILAGLGRLKQEHTYFSTAWIMTWLLLPLSITEWFIFVDIPLGNGLDQIPAAALVLQVTGALVRLTVLYTICRAVQVMAEKQRKIMLRNAAKLRLQWYLFFEGGWLIVMPFGFNMDANDFTLMFMGFAVGLIASTLAVILLIRKSGNILKSTPKHKIDIRV